MTLWPVFTSRLFLGGAAAVFLAASITLGWHAGLAKKEAREESARADKLRLSIERPVTGFRDRLVTCRASTVTLEGAIDQQSEQIRAWQAEAERLQTESAAATRAAEARVRTLERQLVGARRAQPRAGETVCQAADRLILERAG